MKYIRTKDGRIFYTREKEIVDTDELKWEAIPKGCKDYFTLNYKDEDIIKQADTIEELCDEFVVLDNRPPKSKKLEKDFDKLFRWFNKCKISQRDIIIYGAIWTDKGLIYVAKLNDKGELELL